MPRSSGAAALFYGFVRIGSRDLPGRHNTEQKSCENSYCRREQKNNGIQMKPETGDNLFRPQNHRQAVEHVRDADAQQRAEERKHKTFCKRLTKQMGAACSKRNANREFARAATCSCEHQAGNIQTRNKQNEADRTEKYEHG